MINFKDTKRHLKSGGIIMSSDWCITFEDNILELTEEGYDFEGRCSETRKISWTELKQIITRVTRVEYL